MGASSTKGTTKGTTKRTTKGTTKATTKGTTKATTEATTEAASTAPVYRQISSPIGERTFSELVFTLSRNSRSQRINMLPLGQCSPLSTRTYDFGGAAGTNPQMGAINSNLQQNPNTSISAEITIEGNKKMQLFSVGGGDGAAGGGAGSSENQEDGGSPETRSATSKESVDTMFSDREISRHAKMEDDTSSAPQFSISKLIPVLTRDLHRYVNRFPNFSYQFGWNGELTAYVSDLSNDAVKELEKELQNLLCRYIPAGTVTVVPSLPTITLCYGGIGSTLSVEERTQLVGLYLQYDGDGTIFWVSSAHGLFRVSDRGHFQVPNHEVRRIRSRFSACRDFRAVDLHAPYAVFHDNGVVISNSKDIVRKLNAEQSKDHALEQHTLYHFVDMMIGPIPLTSWHVRDRQASYAVQLTSAVDGCGDPLCSMACHASKTQFYRITNIRYFETMCDENLVLFNMEDLNNNQLISYLGGHDQLAIGTASVTPYNHYVTIVAGQRIMQDNMIVIKPTEDSCRPRQGHSGSVWVQQRGNECEAVAITCAVIQCPEKPALEMWLAAPLCACLLALSEENQQVFEDYTHFTVLI